MLHSAIHSLSRLSCHPFAIHSLSRLSCCPFPYRSLTHRLLPAWSRSPPPSRLHCFHHPVGRALNLTLGEHSSFQSLSALRGEHSSFHSYRALQAQWSPIHTVGVAGLTQWSPFEQWSPFISPLVLSPVLAPTLYPPLFSRSPFLHSPLLSHSPTLIHHSTLVFILSFPPSTLLSFPLSMPPPPLLWTGSGPVPASFVAVPFSLPFLSAHLGSPPLHPS
jgi:hypothetical protein